MMTSNRSQRIAKAQSLLLPGVPKIDGIWADVGCGDGIFTTALYRLIGPGGQIYGVDQDPHKLKALARHFADAHPEASVQTIQADFTRSLPLPPLDGLIMANALHFVQDKVPVLTRLVELLKPGGRLILVEYNTDRGNFAVPYPLDERAFLELARQVGLTQTQILACIPSSFLGQMYAGMGLKPDP